MAVSTLFIGNLPYSTTEGDLRDLFERVGVPVRSVRIVTDMDSGRSRGHGFVEVPGTEAAERAKAELNGFKLDGRLLVVDDARLRRRGSRDPGRDRGRGPERGREP